MMKILRTCLVLAFIGGGTAAPAQEAPGWEFQISPYGWFTGLKGEVGAIPGSPPVDVDLSFGDIVENLDMGGMLLASARKGPWVLYVDTIYSRLSTTESLGGVIFDSVRIRNETSYLALAAGRTIARSPRGSVDAYIGARAWWMKNRFELRDVGGGRSSRTEKADWIDPMIGIAARYRASDRWGLFGALEAGGFGVGADSEWSVLAGATYQVTDRFGASFGWRHLEVDYDRKGILFDASLSGPLVGATFRF